MTKGKRERERERDVVPKRWDGDNCKSRSIKKQYYPFYERAHDILKSVVGTGDR